MAILDWQGAARIVPRRDGRRQAASAIIRDAFSHVFAADRSASAAHSRGRRRSPDRAVVRGRCAGAVPASTPRPAARSRARSRPKEFQAQAVRPVPRRRSPTAAGARGGSRSSAAGQRGERGSELLRKLATAAGLAARQRRVGARRRSSCAATRRRRCELAQAVAEGLTLAEFNGGSYKTADPPPAPPPAWTVVVDRCARERRADASRRGRARPHARRVQQPGARAGQRAGQHADAARVRDARARRWPATAASTVEILDETQIAELGMGLLLGVARGSSEPPRLIVFRHDPPGAPDGAGARPGRQGHHVRHRRHLDQAGRRHGADEGRHGRRRRGRLRDARDRAAEGADPRHRRRADDREHAGRPRDQAGRHPDERRRARPSKSSTPTPKAG